VLQGVPDTEVKVTFERDEPAVTNLGGNVNERHAIKGKPGTFVHTAVLLRQSVQISDIRLATFIGPETDGIGYINLAGFNAGAGRDFRTAFNMLKYSALKPTGGEGLKGLILDLRGNPGGLLDAAVEIASYLVPPGSDIVTSKTRGGPELV
jgi:carboxyl-terminal processing protease